MARLPLAQRTVDLAPVTGARQQAQNYGADAVAQGMDRLASGVGNMAKGLEVRETKIAEASVQAWDAEFAQSVREIERGFLSAKAGNAVSTSTDASKAWDELQRNYMGRAQTPLQRQMLNNALGRRRERWQSQFDSHILRETDAWETETFNGRVAQMSIDAADLPIGSAERDVAFADLTEVLIDRARRQGLGADAAAAMVQETFTGVHTSTINNLLSNGDALEAERYMTENAAEISPDKRAELTAKVRGQVREYHVTVSLDEADFDPVDDVEVDIPVTDTATGASRVERRTEKPIVPFTGAVNVTSGVGRRDSLGGRISGNHIALDYGLDPNTQVRAAMSGVVSIRDDLDGYGRYVVLDHGNGYETYYAHLNAVDVRDGQTVEQGQTIARSGGARGADGAGNSTGPHLHFELRRNGQKVDPNAHNHDLEIGGVSGRAATGQPRRERVGTSGVPTQDADIGAWARRRAETLGYGGDWQMIKALEDGARSRLNQQRSDRNNAESEAWRVIQTYLPNGDNPAASFDAIPEAVRNAVGPAYRNTARASFEAAANSEERIDRDTADNIYNNFMSQVQGTPEQQDAFLKNIARLEEERNNLTRSQYNSLQAQARALRASQREAGATPAAERVNRLNPLSGLETAVNQYATMNEIMPSRNTDAEVMRNYNAFRSYVTDYVLAYAANNNGRRPDDETLRNFMNGAFRDVYLGEGREEGQAYQRVAGMPMFERIPNSERKKLVERLKDNLGRNPSETEIANAWRDSYRNAERTN